jgi:hypothetical protein
MTSGEASVSELGCLRMLEPDPERARRVQARCREALARQAPRVAPGRATGWSARLDLALLGGLCLSYLLAILFDVLAVYGRH